MKMALSNEKAILIIDMIPGCINEKGRKRDQQQLDNQVASICQLLSSGNGVPVFFAEYEPYGSTVPEIAECANNPEVVYKRCESAFYGTELYQKLKDINARQLYIAGINLSACVYSTAKSARKIGLEVITAPDLVTDFIWCEYLKDSFTNKRLDYFKENTTFLKDCEEVIGHLVSQN